MAKITNILQIGMTTANLEDRIAKYEKVGIGPWKVNVDSRKRLGAPASNTKFRGEPIELDVRVAHCMLNGLELELIQPMDNKGPYAEHLKLHGEGYIHHLCIAADDNKELRKVLKKENCPSEWKGDVDPQLGPSFEYYDTRDLLGFYIEVLDNEPVPDAE